MRFICRHHQIIEDILAHTHSTAEASVGPLPAGDDLARMVVGLRTVEALVTSTRALGRRVAARLSPTEPLADAEALRAHARATGQTLYHPVGTCRMGADEDAVVDPSLRVRGVAGLRVADASVMPTIVRGHTNAAALAIGARAADLVGRG